jgi:molecular chaperone DnaJ
VEPDHRFDREGTTLHAAVTVDFVEAALGAQVQMESLDGEFTLKVPGGTQPGQVIKAKGKGLPPLHGGRRGDMMVRVEVSIPTRLTSEQKKLLESYLETRKDKVGK